MHYCEESSQDIFYELQRSFVQLCPVHRSYICKDDSSQTKNTSTGNELILRIMFSFQMYEILNWGTDQIRGIDLEWPQWICNPWAEPAYLGFCKYLVELRFFRIFKPAQSQHIFSIIYGTSVESCRRSFLKRCCQGHKRPESWVLLSK